MAVATRIFQYLARQAISYQQVHHERVGTLVDAVKIVGIPRDSVARAEMLIDAKGVMMVVLPLDYEMDLEDLNQQLNRDFQRLAERQADRLFHDCEPGSRPPLSTPYGLPAVIDEALLEKEQVYCQSGCHSTLIRMDVGSFCRANVRALKRNVGRPMEEKAAMTKPVLQQELVYPATDTQKLSERLRKIYRLPPMPAVAARILRIVADPDSSLAELCRVIEQDPSLAAQVMRYANSALFGYRGELRNVQDAVRVVLGFDRVSHIAMGIAASRAFDIPREGPLGLDAFWQHALQSSFLSQQLAKHVPNDRGINPETAYLAGLLHNFGTLLIGHLFRPEFILLNRLAEKNPETSLAILEKQVFGMGGARELIGLGHGAVGAILLEHWNLPPEVCKVASMHHAENYQGEYAGYVQLVQLANSLLKDLAIGDDLCLDDPGPLMKALGLAHEVAYEIFRQVQEHAPAVQTLARQMAA